jgi:RNA polymerase sigma-B factor
MNEILVAEHLRSLPGAPRPAFRHDLPGLEDRELLALTASLPRSSQTRAGALDLLVTRYRNLVRSCVQRYTRSPESAEDLMQVGYVGLLKAINNFDPAFGFSLTAYAEPCITGELKKHFRDKRWQVHVARRLQERVLEVRQAEHSLTQQLGHMPTDCELAGELGIGAADVREARQAEQVLQPFSLDESLRGQPGSASLDDLLGAEDPRLEHMLGMQAIATHWAELPAREQQIVVLRYYRGMTQAQIGKQIGISQMQVSRLLAHALGYLRPRLFGQPEFVSGAISPPHRHHRRGIPLAPPGSTSPSGREGPSPPEPDDLNGQGRLMTASRAGFPADIARPASGSHMTTNLRPPRRSPAL